MVTKCIREKMHNTACYFVGESLNHIHQDAKSARLIAVCKCSLSLSHNCKKMLFIVFGNVKNVLFEIVGYIFLQSFRSILIYVVT